jgi:hypothetical protein
MKKASNTGPIIFGMFVLLIVLITCQVAFAINCGEKPVSVKNYEQISLYALIAGFGLLFAGILVDKKSLKTGLLSLSVIPFLAWGYANFFVDYQKFEKIEYNFKLQAENTLANIAEAQDRYKSERDTYIKDLAVLESHISGAHGMDECVSIVKLDATWDHWAAGAKHIYGSSTVYWDSEMGSSLKRG